MAKVVEYKDLNLITCNHCGKLIQYERKDIRAVHDSLVEGCWTVINCPNCNNEIQVDYFNGKIIR